MSGSPLKLHPRFYVAFVDEGRSLVEVQGGRRIGCGYLEEKDRREV